MWIKTNKGSYVPVENIEAIRAGTNSKSVIILRSGRSVKDSRTIPEILASAECVRDNSNEVLRLAQVLATELGKLREDLGVLRGSIRTKTDKAVEAVSENMKHLREHSLASTKVVKGCAEQVTNSAYSLEKSASNVSAATNNAATIINNLDEVLTECLEIISESDKQEN